MLKLWGDHSHIKTHYFIRCAIRSECLSLHLRSDTIFISENSVAIGFSSELFSVCARARSLGKRSNLHFWFRIFRAIHASLFATTLQNLLFFLQSHSFAVSLYFFVSVSYILCPAKGEFVELAKKMHRNLARFYDKCS